MKGWECATVTLAAIIRAETWRSSAILAALSGLINPLMLLFLLFSLTPSLRRSRALSIVRRVLAILMLLFMVATWVLFRLMHLTPVIGHVLWIAGALIILAADLWIGRPAAPAEAGIS